MTSDGDKTSIHFKLTQSGVSDDFTMLVPLYVEFENKQISLLGRAKMKGSTTIEQTIPLGKPASAPRRILANYNFDLLSD